MLRNAGNDCQYTRFRDKLNQSLVADRDILTQGMDPCVVFINGEYWGHYEITEKLSDDYIEAHYGVNKNDVCIIKNSGLEEGEDSGYFEWQNLYNWVSVTDFSKPENYEQLCEKIDMQSFADYLSTEFYIGNMDFAAHNTAMWKATAVDDSNEWADGRWRFILFDTEFSADLYGTKGPAGNYDTFRALMNNNCFLSALFNSALRNADFKQMFSTTFADMANENFRTADVLNEIDRLSDEYREMAIGVYNRFEPAWLGGENAEPSYNYEVSILSEFYKNRFRNAMNHLKSNCGLKGNQVQVTLNNNTSEGTVTMNTITPAFTGNKWEGTYYTDYPVTVNAKPTAGYKFSHWETSDGRSYYTPTAEISLSSSVTITAVYDEAGDIMGDVNLDGDVNTADLVMLSKWLLGSGELTDWTKADTYSDGIIDVYDLVGLRKIVIG